jgi:predicted GNAT family N-acyltransferase
MGRETGILEFVSAPEIRRIPAAETRGLRHTVLRPNQPPQLAIYPGDDDADTLHLGLYMQGRLGGVAVDMSLRGQGHGATLLRACLEHAVQQGGTLVWCNARTTASGFYRSLGFSLKGDTFELPGIGPHHCMQRTLESFR